MTQQQTIVRGGLPGNQGPEKGLVTIIVPVYNGEEYLRQSLDSILAQTYPKIEILVMDDASTDATSAILHSYDDRIQVFRQASNRGIYGNANDGISMARGEFIAVYHADDVYAPTIVEREVEFLTRYPEAGAVFTNMIFIGPDSQAFGIMNLPKEVPGDRPLQFREIVNGLLFNTNRFLMCPTAMIRASVHREVGVYRDDVFRNTSDVEMWLRISRKYPVGILEDRLIRYRHFHNSSSLRYHRLRTEPGRFFTIMDLYLNEGATAVACPEAIAAHEAHRSEDLLMAAVSNYILGRRSPMLELLSRVRVKHLLGSAKIQRWRMFTLFLLLHVVGRVPRISPLADAFHRRWHAKPVPKRKVPLLVEIWG